MRIFLYISAAGLIASAIVHFASYFRVDFIEMFPPVWVLHLGIFLVAIPAGVSTETSPQPQGKKRPGNKMLSSAPAWMQRLVTVAVYYALVNIIVSVILIGFSASGQARRGPGNTFYSYYSGTTQPITAAQYHNEHARLMRLFSGHWMAFYAAAMAGFGSAINARKAPAPLPVIPADAPLSAAPIPLQYGKTTRAPPIWLHQSMVQLSEMVGWLGVPLLLILGVVGLMRLWSWFALLIVPALFGGAFGGRACLPWLLRTFLPAQCPACGGRAYWRSSKPIQYTCWDCGRVHPPLRV